MDAGVAYNCLAAILENTARSTDFLAGAEESDAQRRGVAHRGREQRRIP
jgi:hypothetical protein